MIKYTLQRTDTADIGVQKIIIGIPENCGKAVALQKLDETEKAITVLEDQPYAGSMPRYAVLRRMGYRVLILENSLVFYKVDDVKKEVTIYAIVDQREDYLKVIKGL